MKPTLIAAGALVLLAGCGEEKKQRGLELLPDMFHTPAYESQDALTRREVARNPDGSIKTAEDGTAKSGRTIHAPSALVPPAGTVARGEPVYPTSAKDPALAEALANPYLPTAAVLIRGRDLYQVNCAVCHGTDGNSQHGYIAKQFSGIPSLTGVGLAAYSDGGLFQLITHGKNNRMPALSGQILPDDRWKLIHYVRTLGRAQTAGQEHDAVVRAAEGAVNVPAAAAKAVIESRDRDAAIIQAGGGEAFKPKPPAPAYIKPVWDDAKPKEKH
jgi:mono/diheme cytochrome c family protein